jgi:putative radical SAM enzyme (TIGR03279 family)
MEQFHKVAAQMLPSKVYPERKLTWVVGNAVEKAFEPLLQHLNAVEGLEVNMQALSSDYWGQSMSVTGLLTGHDLLLNLSGQDLGQGILLPSVMLKHDESLFLDDMHIEDVARQLKTKILPVAGVTELIDSCIH